MADLFRNRKGVEEKLTVLAIPCQAGTDVNISPHPSPLTRRGNVKKQRTLFRGATHVTFCIKNSLDYKLYVQSRELLFGGATHVTFLHKKQSRLQALRTKQRAPLRGSRSISTICCPLTGDTVLVKFLFLA